jgi:hypothetical protein
VEEPETTICFSGGTRKQTTTKENETMIKKRLLAILHDVKICGGHGQTEGLTFQARPGKTPPWFYF